MKGNVLKKFLCTCLVTAAAFAATTISASACTTIYVGGDLVEEGTPFVARTEDYGSDYNKFWFISESGKWKQGDHYVGCPEYGPFEWDFTHDSYRFTYFTNDIYYDSICPECGEKADHYRMQNSPESKAENPFTDVKADAYYANAVLWAVENGVTTGASATTFDPAGDCTSGQIVTFLYRCLSK